MKKYTFALLGNGYSGSVIANAWADGHLPQFDLVATYGKNFQRAQQFAQHFNCKPCHNLEELLATKPDFIAEAASGAAVKEYAEQILRSGVNLVVLSAGVFADKEFYEHIKQVALESERRVYIASGAVGGFDILRATTLMGPVKASIRSIKHPMSLYGTGFFTEEMMTATEPLQVFNGTTKEAIEILPTHFNVAIATALASAGPEETEMEILSVPGFGGDEYKIEIRGEEIHAELHIYSADSKIAGWSVIAALQNAVNPIVF